MPDSNEQGLMRLGKIIRPHGIRGELRMQIFTAYPDRILYLKKLILNPENRPRQKTEHKLLSARLHRDVALLTIEGIESRTDADTLRGMIVSVSLEEGAPLEEGEYYVFELIGMAVITDTGEHLGEITRIFETGANDVFIIQSEQHGEVLIPDTEEVVLDIDLDKRQMTIHVLPGLIPDPPAKKQKQKDDTG